MPQFCKQEHLDKRELTFDSATMYTFARSAALEAIRFDDPGVENRVGPPLTQGSLFMLLATVAGESLPAEAHSVLRRLDADGWYQGQLLETLINKLEDDDAELPEQLGRNIYFMYRTVLQQGGIDNATTLFERLPGVWMFATRGESGVWRTRKVADKHWIAEAEQPYNCMFERGAVIGFVEAFDGRDVSVEHTTCRRKGHAYCTFEVRWQE